MKISKLEFGICTIIAVIIMAFIISIIVPIENQTPWIPILTLFAFLGIRDILTN